MKIESNQTQIICEYSIVTVYTQIKGKKNYKQMLTLVN